MICHKLYKYDQTEARCRRKRVCRNCEKYDHISDKTNKCPNQSRCENCGGGHVVGSSDCVKGGKE